MFSYEIVKKIAFNADKDGQAIRFLDPCTGDSRSGKLVYVLKPLPNQSNQPLYFLTIFQITITVNSGFDICFIFSTGVQYFCFEVF